MALAPNSTSLKLVISTRPRTSKRADWGLLLRNSPTIIPELRRIVKSQLKYPILWASVAEILEVTEKLSDLEECEIDTHDGFAWGRRRNVEYREGAAYLPSTLNGD